MNATARIKGAPDPAKDVDASEDLGVTVADLRRQVGELVEAVRKVAVERGGDLTDELAEGFDEATRAAARRGRESRAAVEGAIHDNPLLALGVAAGLGLLFGLAMRR